MEKKLKKARDKAIEAAGGVNKLALALSITPGAVSMWKEIPAARVGPVSQITGLSPHELRPDLFPAKAVA